MNPAIEIKNLHKSFCQHSGALWKKSPRHSVLSEINLQIQQGESFALLGPNGAGKTTLMRILCTLVLPDSGSARILGFDLAMQASAIRRKVSLLMNEEKSFYWRLTGRQNLRFFASLYGLGAE